jgi:hypothetical protein
LILDAAGARALRAHAAAASGRAPLSEDSLRSVVALPNGGVYEIRFDGTTGLPVEENLFAGGRLRMQRTMIYQPVAGSELFARVRQVTEFAHPSVPKRRLVLEESFTPTIIR